MKKKILFMFLAVAMVMSEGCAEKETGEAPKVADAGEARQEEDGQEEDAGKTGQKEDGEEAGQEEDAGKTGQEEGAGENGKETDAGEKQISEEKDGDTNSGFAENGASAGNTEENNAAARPDNGQEPATALEDAFGTLTEEEKILNERMEYYRKSAYYPEIVDYWENVREVRDVSNRIDPLYESDVRFLTKEELAGVPPMVIHLAKNEIYARHGYIFKDQDLYNYFMGCIWYTPVTAPEKFSDAVFNDYEKENLKLLSELDASAGTADNGEARKTEAGKGGNGKAQEEQAKAAFDSALGNLWKNHTLPDGSDLGYDGISDLSENEYAIYDIDHDGKEELIVIWVTTMTAGMTEAVYGFDSATGTVMEELREYPMQTFYDNGIVEAGLSHNHGLAGDMDFWPYTFYRYDRNADAYTVAAEVDAWNKEFYEKDFSGRAFPDDADADGDGVVFKVTVGGSEKLMDLEEYKGWRDSFIGGAKEAEIPFQKMGGWLFQ